MKKIILTPTNKIEKEEVAKTIQRRLEAQKQKKATKPLVIQLSRARG